MDETQRDDALPKWVQLKRILLNRIARGDFDPDQVFCTQQDLMAEQGVSYATVSRALSELVRGGYLYRKRGVGTFVRPLADKKSEEACTIGLLVWDREHTLEHPAFSRLVDGLSEPIREAGHNLAFIFANAEQCRSGELAPTIRRAKVRALIAPTQPMMTEASLRPIADEGLPIVPLNLDCPNITPCAIHFDIAGATEVAAEHLIACGYRKVILMVPDNAEALPRTAGYQRALRAAGISEQRILAELGGRPLPREVGSILSSLEPPVGIIASDDIAALTTVRVAGECGWDVPSQLGVVGVGDFMPPEIFETALTTIRVPFAKMGQIAAKMACDLIEGRIPDPPTYRLPANLIARETTVDLTAAHHVQSRS